MKTTVDFKIKVEIIESDDEYVISTDDDNMPHIILCDKSKEKAISRYLNAFNEVISHTHEIISHAVVR